MAIPVNSERRTAFIERGGLNSATCDLCRMNGDAPRTATDYHHIFNKGLTGKNESARLMSNNHHICAVLCAECHLGMVHTPEYAEKLLLHNCLLYGHAPVKAMYDEMVQQLGFYPVFAMPTIKEVQQYG